MKNRVCFIGNSHMAALKRGWDEVSPLYPDIEATFFGSRSQTLIFTSRIGNKIVGEKNIVKKTFIRTGGTAFINLDEYDFFCIVGGGLHVRVLFSLTESFSHAHHKTLDAQLVSEDFLVEMQNHKVYHSAAAHVARLIRAGVDKPIFVIPEPFWCEMVANQKGIEERKKLLSIMSLGYSQSIVSIFQGAIRRTFADLATVIWQDEKTVVEGVFTEQSFFKSGVGLKSIIDQNQGLENGDGVHANSQYGIVVLMHLFDVLLPSGAYERHRERATRILSDIPQRKVKNKRRGAEMKVRMVKAISYIKKSPFISRWIARFQPTAEPMK